MKKQSFCLLPMLIIGLGTQQLASSQNIPSGSRPIIIGAVLTAEALIVGTGVYLYNRESNNHLIEKVEALWKATKQNVTINPHLVTSIPALKEIYGTIVPQLKQDVHNRYTSWITPWNWDNTMSLAYKKITIIDFMFKYSDIIRFWKTPINASEIQHLSKSLGIETSSYSAAAFAKLVQKDISSITLLLKNIDCSFGSSFLNHLEYIYKDISSMALATEA
ncbi:hypothetical protein HYV11_03780 [Candidatus Dependentiae bacterium]|nr:hypothetical protein [Candidatus Dependentiae bacterium]